MGVLEDGVNEAVDDQQCCTVADDVRVGVKKCKSKRPA